MNELKMFDSLEFGEIRTMVFNNEIWFIGKDIAHALGYKDTADAIRNHVEQEDKMGGGYTDPYILDTMNRKQYPIFINESGLYSLMLSSKLPNARKFKHWVTSEVLPSIRQHGAYMTPETLQKALTSPDFLIELALKLKEQQEQIGTLTTKVEEQSEQLVEQQALICELEPKVTYLQLICDSPDLLDITQIAKDYGYSGQKLNSLLYELKVQYKSNDQWVLFSKYQGKGYVRSCTVKKLVYGEARTYLHTKWTQSGRLFIYNLLKEKKGIVPLCEME